MKSYEVSIQITGYTTITVNALDEEDAESMAIDIAVHELDKTDFDYEILESYEVDNDD